MINDIETQIQRLLETKQQLEKLWAYSTGERLKLENTLHKIYKLITDARNPEKTTPAQCFENLREIERLSNIPASGAPATCDQQPLIINKK